MRNIFNEKPFTFERKANILLIGSSGKLGASVLHKFLKENSTYNVGLLVRSPTNQNGVQKVFLGDILKDSLLPAVSWADIVINCSGFVSYNRKDKDLLYSTNVTGVKNILDACVKLKKPLVHTSSAIAYGSSPTPIIFKEKDLVNQVYRGEYAQTKILSDQMITQSPIPYIIFRPGTLISTLTKLYKFYEKGFVAELKGGASFALREEVANAYVAGTNLLLGEKIQAVYNLGGNNLKFLEVFENFKKMNYKKTRLVSSKVLSALSITNDYLLSPVFKKNIITRDNFITGSHFTFIDSSKAQKELKYNIPPFHLSLNEVINNDNKRRRNS